ncbi:DNA repair protein RadA [candidate division WOR-3 bacterium]|nr:DNA repair protein RadA [candidate division WOR-3 bacterium]
MAKQQRKYVCQECGYSSPQWLGRCPGCGAWDTFIEEISKVSAGLKPAPTRIPSKPLSEIKISPTIRIHTKIQEFDRVLGGGIVEGSLVLVGGEPGIGKSTLLLQAVHQLGKLGKKVLYISGEESPTQIKLRAKRFGMEGENIYILAQTDIEEIVSEIEALSPDIVVVDSIQTVYHSEIGAIPGSITQVKECALRFMRVAKSDNIPIFLIGHVTKEGAIAGPRTLEHMVDTVLYLEGDKNHFYRILRASKNRFGSTQEIGIFEMKEKGMTEVKDPSFIFLGEREEALPGNVVTCAMEGSRSFLVEIQALLAYSVYKIPQRVSAGISYKRLSMLLAVIERRLGIKVSAKDVFINVVGGLHIEETSVDLAIILAIVSGIKDTPISPKTVILGEVGLGGEVRPIALADKRVKEIERLGFKECILPSKCKVSSKNIKITKVRSVREAIYETISHHSKL